MCSRNSKTECFTINIYTQQPGVSCEVREKAVVIFVAVIFVAALFLLLLLLLLLLFLLSLLLMS